MFQRILIANRGEIAVRIIRACREMGIEPVAVYSDVDRRALHVRQAGLCEYLGPAQASESYLNIPRILEAARRSGAEAIHPGYGFLSENPAFARACREAGIVFIGPSPESMEMLGSKTRARQNMKKANVPIVPGTDRGLTSAAEALALAESIGYPVMLKAAAGGGGKGMRLVANSRELPSAMQAAQSEALRSFGDSEVYLEKFLENPRHVEMQIFGDTYGNVVYLAERECSVQRRHQKVLEEAPCAFVDPAMRRRMGEVAVQAAKSAHYCNAGTIEFLVDAAGNFYFLEMNTRLQVEHPVTELVTGIDLVQLQIRVAAGEPLPFEQQDITLRGHAIELRIYAEDPRTISSPRPDASPASSSPPVPASGTTAACTRDGTFPSTTIRCWPSSSPTEKTARRSSPACAALSASTASAASKPISRSSAASCAIPPSRPDTSIPASSTACCGKLRRQMRKRQTRPRRRQPPSPPSPRSPLSVPAAASEPLRLRPERHPLPRTRRPAPNPAPGNPPRASKG